MIAFQMLVDERDGLTSYDLEHGYLETQVYKNHESELTHMFRSFEEFEASVLKLQKCNEGRCHTIWRQHRTDAFGFVLGEKTNARQ